MTNKDVKIDNLFHQAGIECNGTVELNENTYDFDSENPKNSWLYGTLCAFGVLKQQGFSPATFATIGTGSGVDSIGAEKVFNLKKIYQTDIHPKVLEIAHKNLLKFIGSSVEAQTYWGDLCKPLIEKNISVDFLYANIPNIPSDKPVWGGKVSASRFEKRTDECPEILEKWLLGLQYRFLKQAAQVLNPKGVALVAIGDRVPESMFSDLFKQTRYRYSELFNMYKIQTEPEEIVVGYADQESKENIEFDFYDHEKALVVWQNECEGKNLAVSEIKDKLLPFRVSATSALKMYRDNGKSVGHIYTIFKLQPSLS